MSRIGTLLAAALVVCGLPLAAQDEEAAARMLLTAQQQMRDGNSEAALTEYNELLERFPNSRSAPRALADSAAILFESGSLERADRLAERLIESHGSSAEGAEAEVLRAKVTLRAASSLADLAKAGTRLQRVPTLFGTESFPDLPARAESRLLAARTSALLGDPGSALAGYLETLEDEPIGAWTSEANLGMAKVLLARESWQAAAELFQTVASNASGGELSNPRAAAEARTFLALLHRMWLRPLASEPRWQKSRRLDVGNLKKPKGVAASIDGQIAIADPGSSSLFVMTTTGGLEINGLARSAGRPWFDADGQIYLATADSVQLLTARKKASFVVAGDKPKPLSKIQAGATGLFGETLVIDKDLDRLAIFDRAGQATLIGGERSEPIDVATDPSGRIYVLTTKPGRVSVFGPDLRPVVAFSLAADRPIALAVDLIGNVYVLDGAQNAVEVRTREGVAIETLGPLLPDNVELRGPEDVAVDGIGRIFVADDKLGAVVVVD